MQIIRAAATDTVKGNAAYEIHDKRKKQAGKGLTGMIRRKAGTLVGGGIVTTRAVWSGGGCRDYNCSHGTV